MRRAAITLAACAFLAAAGAPARADEALTPAPAEAPRWIVYQGAQELQIRNGAMVLRVDAENRSDVAVSVVNPGALPDPRVRKSGRRVVIDSNAGRIEGCGRGGARVARRGAIPWARTPQVHVRMPADAVITVSGAVHAQIGPMRSARLRLAGCGDTVFGPVRDDLFLSATGAGDVHGGGAGTAEIVLAGAGDVHLGEIGNGLTISAVGSGDVRTGGIRDGDVRIVLQGSGDVTLGDGEAQNLTVILAGGGDVTFPGRARNLDAVVAGGGDVRVGRVTGNISRRVAGGGEVTIGRR